MSLGLTRHLIRGLIPALLGEGLSANAALKLLISQDLHIRRKTFLDDWREIKGVKKASNAWKYTPRKYKIPEEAFVPSAKNLGASRQYIFDVDVFDSYTDEVFQTKYSFTSNNILTRKKAEETMSSIITQASAVNEDYQDLSVVSVWFDVGLIRQDART